MNIISSSEGLSILRNWKTQRTLLWLFSLDTGDFATKLEAKVLSCGEDRVTLMVDDSEKVFSLESTEFFTLSADESPFPGLARVRRFLGMRFPGDAPEVILAEPTIT
jgi:hypothetical protein